MDRFWLSSYQEGVPHDIDSTAYDSIVGILDDVNHRFSEKIAFSNFGTKITFQQFDQLSKQFAAYLQSLPDLEKGDRVAIMLPNILQYPIALFGALRGGYTIVNVDPMYKPRELIHQLNDSNAKVLLFLENFADVVEKSLPDMNVKHLISTQVGDQLNFPKSLLINTVLKYVKKMVPKHGLTSVISFNQVIKAGERLSFSDVTLNHDDVAFLQYTGGTTGVSKGAILTHGNIVANVMQVRSWAAKLLLEGQEKIITALPLYHIFSLTANCLYIMSIGGENVLITNPRDFKGFIKLIAKEKFTVITGVNTLFRKMLDTDGFDQVDFSAVKITFGGGMAITQDVAVEWKQRTGKHITEAYGLTETSPAACINPFHLHEYNSFIGLPIPSTFVQIKDDEGHDLGVNQTGELCIKGPQVTQGYWNLPELNDTAFTADGYFRTGDIAQINDEGFVKILDRKKDMILVSGFNVYANEVDNVISSHSGVVEAASIGIPDDTTGEAIKSFVVKADKDLSKETLLDYCKENLTGYKRPKFIEFVDELPKSNVGKILRKNLR
ncbi:MAG: AMP-binding protein [Cellvibrionaceae bacterium]